MKLSAFVLAIAALAFTSLAQAANKIKVEDGYGVSVRAVKQYRNLMPTIVVPGQPVANRTITLIDFEAAACRKLGPEDFKVNVQTKGVITYLQVARLPKLADCRAVPTIQEVSISTDLVEEGNAVIVLNPIQVEALPNVH